MVYWVGRGMSCGSVSRGLGGRLCACAVLQVVRRIGWCDGEDTLLQVAVWVWVYARLEEYLLPYGGLVWVQVGGGGDWWVCSGRGSWHPLVLVALEGLRVRVRVDRTPGADMVVALRVLGVKDFKYCAGGVVRWGWADVPGLAWVDRPGGAW